MISYKQNKSQDFPYPFVIVFVQIDWTKAGDIHTYDGVWQSNRIDAVNRITSKL